MPVKSRIPEREGPYAVRGMFDRIAPRYDLGNRVLSLGIDKLWRRRLIRELALASDGRVLDLCCGTGDLVRMAARQGPHAVGIDFSSEMLRVACRQRSRSSVSESYLQADVLALPFADNSYQAATIAFGIRNLVDLNAGLKEMYRVLSPGGRLAVLEFSQPEGVLWGAVYSFYRTRILPWAGGVLSGERKAYRYLAETIGEFLTPEEMSGMMVKAGFDNVRHLSFSGGVAVLHLSHKPASST